MNISIETILQDQNEHEISLQAKKVREMQKSNIGSKNHTFNLNLEEQKLNKMLDNYRTNNV